MKIIPPRTQVPTRLHFEDISDEKFTNGFFCYVTSGHNIRALVKDQHSGVYGFVAYLSQTPTRVRAKQSQMSYTSHSCKECVLKAMDGGREVHCFHGASHFLAWAVEVMQPERGNHA